MSTVLQPSLLDEVYEFLLSRPTPKQILDYHPSEALQTRVSNLLDHKKQGMITPEEDADLETFARANQFMNILKAKARLKLKNNEYHTHS